MRITKNEDVTRIYRVYCPSGEILETHDDYSDTLMDLIENHQSEWITKETPVYKCGTDKPTKSRPSFFFETEPYDSCEWYDLKNKGKISRTICLGDGGYHYTQISVDVEAVIIDESTYEVHQWISCLLGDPSGDAEYIYGPEEEIQEVIEEIISNKFWMKDLTYSLDLNPGNCYAGGSIELQLDSVEMTKLKLMGIDIEGELDELNNEIGEKLMHNDLLTITFNEEEE